VHDTTLVRYRSGEENGRSKVDEFTYELSSTLGRQMFCDFERYDQVKSLPELQGLRQVADDEVTFRDQQKAPIHMGTIDAHGSGCAVVREGLGPWADATANINDGRGVKLLHHERNDLVG
jgi:hypothetical protein